MATWKVARAGKVCALTGKPLPPDAPILTALFGLEDEVSEDRVKGSGLLRRDYLVDEVEPAALERAVEGAYCTWRARTPPEHPTQRHRLDLGLARELLERMRAEADPERHAVQLTLALLLVRKRRLHLVAERDATLVLRWPKSEETFEVPMVELTEAEQERLQQEFARLFEF